QTRGACFRFLGADRLALDELRRALALALRDLESRLRTGELRRALLERRLVPARIDAEEHLTRVDDLAGLEQHVLHVAADARAHVDGLDRRDATGQVGVLDELAHLDGLDADRGRGRRAGGRGRLALAALATRREDEQE